MQQNRGRKHANGDGVMLKTSSVYIQPLYLPGIPVLQMVSIHGNQSQSPGW